MTKKLSITVLATALLLSGAFVGVSFGGSGGITEPEEIQLRFNVCSNDGPCRFYRLRDTDDTKTGQITVLKHPLFDADENVVGHVNEFCFASDGPGGKTNWLCTWVNTLNATATTDHGTVVTTGNWDSGRPFAVTGGTGAYVNVRGYATMGNQGRYTLYLIP